METEGLLLYSQVPATDPYTEPDQSNPRPQPYFLKIYFNIIPYQRPGLPNKILLESLKGRDHHSEDLGMFHII
jgi:hypothetical protein